MAIYQLDFGVVTINGVTAGATMGGAKFDTGMEWRFPELDGSRGPIKDISRLVGVVPVLTVTLKDWNAATIATVIAGSSTGYTVTMAGSSSAGGDITITLLNAICTKNSFVMADKDEGSIELEFTACFDDIGGALPFSIVQA